MSKVESRLPNPNDIVAWFVPTRVPEGHAPEEIRENWVNIPLPIRQKNAPRIGGLAIGAEASTHDLGLRMDAVPIEAHDALLSLELSGYLKAANYWLYQMGSLPRELYGTTLSFAGEEGEIIDAKEVKQHVPLADLFEDPNF